MPPNNPSLVKIVLDGGVVMGPFLLITLFWIGCTLRFILNKQRTFKGLVALLMFPLAFEFLALFHWFLHWHAQYKEVELSGFPDQMVYIQNGLVVTRSSLVIAGTGGLSFVVSALMFLLPCSKDNQTNKPAHTTAGNA